MLTVPPQRFPLSLCLLGLSALKTGSSTGVLKAENGNPELGKEQGNNAT